MTFGSQFFELTPSVGLALTGSASLTATEGLCPSKIVEHFARRE